MHGIFDTDEFRRWFIDRLRVHRGLSPQGKVLTQYNLEPALDKLHATATARTTVNTNPMESLLRDMDAS